MKARKLLAALIAAVMTVTLAACGGGDGDNKNVTMWMYPVIADEGKNKTFWDDQKAKFEKDNPGITLSIETRPWAKRDEQLATAIAAGEGPDLVYLIPDQVPQYVESGGIVPVDEVVGELKSKMHPNGLKAVEVDGKSYGVPVLLSVSPLAWNKALFTEAGVTKLPETWEEVKAAAPKLAAKGHPIMNYYGAFPQAYFVPLLWQNGTDLFTEDGKDIAFNSKEGVEALQFLMDLQKVGGLPKDAPIADNNMPNEYFIGKKTAMTANLEAWRVPDTEKALGKDLVVGTGLKNKKAAAFGTVGMISRTKIRDNNTEAANAALKFFGSAEFSKAFNEAASQLPARTDVKLANAGASYKAQIAALEVMSPGAIHPKSRQVIGVLSPNIQAALQGKKTAQQAMDDAAKEAKALL